MTSPITITTAPATPRIVTVRKAHEWPRSATAAVALFRARNPVWFIGQVGPVYPLLPSNIVSSCCRTARP